MKKNLIKLLVATSLSNFAYAETTNNLVSQDFTSGWTNTGNSTHGSTTIAGIHGGTVESDSVSLNSLDINKESLNEGFSITGSAEVWFWNNETQSVTQTIKTVDDNGEVITQNRTLSGSCATWNGCSYGSMTDTLIIGSNSQQDYNVNLKYSFSVPNQTSGHYGADLKNPSLSVTYTYVPPLDSATQTALLDLNNDIKDELKDVDTFKFEEEPVSLNMNTTELQTDTEEMTFQETFTDTALVDNKEETPDLEPKEELSGDQGSTFTESSETSDSSDNELSDSEPAPQEQETAAGDNLPDTQNTEQASESNDTKEESSESGPSQGVADKENKSLDDKKAISLAKSMEKIDQQVKDIGKNLQLKNLVKLKLMSDNNALESYANIEFYKPKNIYLDQIDIRDNRVLYADASLVSYQQKDPLFQAQKELFDIRQEKQKLIREIQVLKNVR